MLSHDMIHLLTAIGLTAGGSSTTWLHFYKRKKKSLILNCTNQNPPSLSVLR